MADIDSLDIQISASVSKAEKSIDRLVVRLDALSKSLGKIGNAGNTISNLGAGVERLARGMQSFKGIGESKFSKLANSVNQLANIDSQGISNVARSLSRIAGAFQNVSGISGNTAHIAELARSLGRLGSKTATTAISNIPQLATAMRNLMDTLSRAPRVSQNLIDMTNALANLASQGSRVGTASNSIERGLNRTSASARRAKKSFGGLASVFGKFYATYFLLIRAFKGLGNSINSTADYIEAFNYQNVALGKIASDWYSEYGYENADAYAESLNERLSEKLGSLSGLQVSIGADGKGILAESGMKNLGLNIQEVTQYASQLASVTNSVGQTGKTSLAAASAFTKLGADISSLFNIDYSSVMGNLQSGLIGQSRALYKYGIDITNATLQTYAYELGLEKAVSEMTQAEKMQLRMIAILDQSKVSWGDLANTIESPSNMIRQFKNNLNETGIVLGQLFIPVLQKVMPVINGVTIAIKRLLANIAGMLGIEINFSEFGQGYTDMEDDIGGVADGFDEATESAKKFNKQLAGFDELNVLSSGNGFGDLSGSVDGYIDLTEEIQKATAEYEAVWSEAYAQMESKAEEFAGVFEGMFSPIEEIIQDFVDGDFLEAGEDTTTLIQKILEVDWKEIRKKVNAVAQKLATYLNGLFTPETAYAIGKTIAESLNTVIGAAFNFLITVDWENAGETVGDGVNGFFDNFDFKGLADTFDALVKGIWAALKAAVAKIDWGSALSAIWDVVTSLDIGTISLVISGILVKNAAGALFTATITKGIIANALGFVAVAGGWQIAIAATAFVTLSLLLNNDDLKEAVEISKNQIENLFYEQEIAPKSTDDNYFKKYETKKNFKYSSPESKNYILDEEEIKKVLGIKDKGRNGTKVYSHSSSGAYFGETNEFAQAAFNAMGNVKNGYQFLGDENVKKMIEQAEKEGEKAGESFVGKCKESMVKAFGSLISSEEIKTKLNSIGTNFGSTISSKIKSKLEESSTINSLINAGKTLGGKILSGIQSAIDGGKITFPTGKKTNGTTLGFKEFLSGITGYATGGFPEDGLFYANHGELVGKFSNGRTAVANNAQITDGIRQAAYEGMMQAIKDSGGISGNVNVSVEADTNGLFRVVQKKANEHFKTTGNPAFMF